MSLYVRLTIPSYDPPNYYEFTLSAAITHNLNTMAIEAGIYRCIWRPSDIGIKKAAQLIEPLKEGLTLLENDPERFKRFNPANGWGTYEELVFFVRGYMEICEEHPKADVAVSR